MSSQKAYVNSNYELIDFDPVRGMHWCRIVGDSMTSKGCPQNLPHGTIFRASPLGRAVSGDIVIARRLGYNIPGSSPYIVGKVEAFDQGWFVDPLNENYEMMCAPGTFEVAGLVTEVMRPEPAGPDREEYGRRRAVCEARDWM